MYRLEEMVRMHRSGASRRRIARMLKMSRNTVRQHCEALQRAGLLDGPAQPLPSAEALQAAVASATTVEPPRQEVSSVDVWTDEILRLEATGSGPKAIYDWLRLECPDFEGSYDAVKRYVRRIRRHAPVRAEDVAIPVHTAPGQVAQVDFGYLGYLHDPETGRQRKTWVFLMVLGHSRHMFADLVFDQCSETWQRLHAAAFA